MLWHQRPRRWLGRGCHTFSKYENLTWLCHEQEPIERRLSLYVRSVALGGVAHAWAFNDADLVCPAREVTPPGLALAARTDDDPL